MKKNTPILNFYHKTLVEEEGIMNMEGLCYMLREHEIKLFQPTEHDEDILAYENTSQVYWGYGISNNDPEYNSFDKYSKFTSLRQTITLFLAAIEGEL